jgi:hypothetical protein
MLSLRHQITVFYGCSILCNIFLKICIFCEEMLTSDWLQIDFIYNTAVTDVLHGFCFQCTCKLVDQYAQNPQAIAVLN